MNEPQLKPRALFRLMGLFSGHWTAVFIGAFLLLLTSGLTLLPPWLVRYSVDAVKRNAGSEVFVHVFVGIVGAALLRGVLYYWQRMLMERTGQDIVHDLRKAAMTAMNRRNFAFFDSAEVGDLVSRVTSDTDTLAGFFGLGLVNILNNVLMIVGVFVVLLVWNPYLSLAFLALIPFMLHAMANYALRVRPAMAKVRKEFGSLTAFVQQRMAGIEVVKFMGTEGIEGKHFQKRAENVMLKNLVASRIQALWLPYVFFLIGLGTAFTVIWGGRMVIANQVTEGMLLGFLSYIALLLRPIRQTGMLLGMVMTSTVAADRLFEITDGGLEDLESGVWPDDLTGAIEFVDVTFSYNEGRRVLRDVSIAIPAGRSVALVGPSGSGKSTFVSLIPGFYQPQAGTVLIDGISTADINLGRLRSSIGFLHQTPFLFDGTILDNLTFGRPDASLTELEQALERTALRDFVLTLPEGLHTEIGEKGVKLSGGQRQRLAMARVLITNPRILILDEPTSSLDRETEAEINVSLSVAFAGRTTVIIAHRLWTITSADVVVFLSEGRIRAVGKHSELLATNREYARFVSSQLERSAEVAI